LRCAAIGPIVTIGRPAGMSVTCTTRDGTVALVVQLTERAGWPLCNAAGDTVRPLLAWVPDEPRHSQWREKGRGSSRKRPPGSSAKATRSAARRRGLASLVPLMRGRDMREFQKESARDVGAVAGERLFGRRRSAVSRCQPSRGAAAPYCLVHRRSVVTSTPKKRATSLMWLPSPKSPCAVETIDLICSTEWRRAGLGAYSVSSTPLLRGRALEWL
jgi:hypothetical protein